MLGIVFAFVVGPQLFCSQMEGDGMSTTENYEEHVAVLRAEVCSRCIERQPGAPPCGPLGKGCGIEQHVPELVDMCRQTDSSQMVTYLNHLHEQICPTCASKDQPSCPCPLDYLLQLAVESIEKVELRRAARTQSATIWR